MVALFCACGLALAQQASLLLLNGKVLTLDTRDTVTEAVAIDGGLITPIIKKADQKGLAAISDEMRDLAARAKDGKIGRAHV